MLDNIESEYPGYDEYRVNADEIEHDPYVLISILFQISKTGAAMTTSINPRFAEQRPIGSLALTRPAFSLSSTIKH